MKLVDKIVGLDAALVAAAVPHAFGGALALAWCTERARATIDIDINLFVDSSSADKVLDIMPAGIIITDRDRRAIAADGQTRLWWAETPVDVFFNTTPFHEAAAGRARVESFGGVEIPFLSCPDLAVFKAFFNRTKDWADLEDMAAVGSLDVEAVLGVLTRYLGADDERIDRLRVL